MTSGKNLAALYAGITIETSELDVMIGILKKIYEYLALGSIGISDGKISVAREDSSRYQDVKHRKE